MFWQNDSCRKLQRLKICLVLNEVWRVQSCTNLFSNYLCSQILFWMEKIGDLDFALARSEVWTSLIILRTPFSSLGCLNLSELDFGHQTFSMRRKLFNIWPSPVFGRILYFTLVEPIINLLTVELEFLLVNAFCVELWASEPDTRPSSDSWEVSCHRRRTFGFGCFWSGAICRQHELYRGLPN